MTIGTHPNFMIPCQRY
jgi:hypothetical protein